MIDTALVLRDLLMEEGLQSWPKVTGSKGIHLMLSLEAKMTHDEAHRYARAIAQRPRHHGDRHVFAASAVGLPIAVPVTWEDVENGMHPDAFTITSSFRKRSRA